MNPETCRGCHPNHYREWKSSMHAYAAEDPIFLAMNARGQREAKLGKFCINCHAPMAVREGATTDGLNMAQVPQQLHGVTCYFCHNVTAVHGDNNNPLELADDTTMRGGIKDPKRSSAHGVGYSKLHDSGELDSSQLCGSCHDIVTPSHVNLERTFAEWRNSLYSHAGAAAVSCGNCHMESRDGLAAYDAEVSVPTRKVHLHLFAGIDTARTTFPDQDVQRAAVACQLRASVLLALCPAPDGTFQVSIETLAGHAFPSGAAQDRRLWLDFVAYDASDKVLYQSGVVPASEVVGKPLGTAGYDPNLKVFHDTLYDLRGNETLMFWEAASSAAHPDGYASVLLPQAKTKVLSEHTVQLPTFSVPQLPARVRVQMHVQPVAREVLDSLVQSGDLDASIVGKLETLTPTGTIVEWQASDGYSQCISQALPDDLDCPNDYLCKLYPELTQCAQR